MKFFSSIIVLFFINFNLYPSSAQNHQPELRRKNSYELALAQINFQVESRDGLVNQSSSSSMLVNQDDRKKSSNISMDDVLSRIEVLEIDLGDTRDELIRICTLISRVRRDIATLRKEQSGFLTQAHLQAFSDKHEKVMQAFYELQNKVGIVEEKEEEADELSSLSRVRSNMFPGTARPAESEAVNLARIRSNMSSGIASLAGTAEQSLSRKNSGFYTLPKEFLGTTRRSTKGHQ